MGALIGTIMAGNVFKVIMPSQRALVAAVSEGKVPNPAWGVKAKLRSTHNTYTTLPLIFVMLSIHYPMTYNHQYNWLVLIAVFILTAVTRWYFVLRHVGKQNVFIPVGVFIGTIVLAYVMSIKSVDAPTTESESLIVTQSGFVKIINKHCTSCHSSTPTDDIFKVAPLGVNLDTYPEMVQWAARIKARAIDTEDMPMMNKSNMSQAERDYLNKWISEEIVQP